VPYIKQGIEDWQVAFEEAGFKNVIKREFDSKLDSSHREIGSLFILATKPN
jgi:hypothetical protein